MTNLRIIFSTAIIGLATVFTSCEKEDTTVSDPFIDNELTTYSFERDGESTVSYSGQEDRISMLNSLGTYLAEVNTGRSISAATAKDMFANQNGAFSAQGYTKDLKSKCKSTNDQAFFEAQMDLMEQLSLTGDSASNGQGGMIYKTGSTSGYLVDANGVEPRQVILKGLMGSVFYYRAIEEYLGNGILDDQNESLLDGKNYTEMEHHYDEAFGYIGIAADLSNLDTDHKDKTRAQYWGEYIVKRHTATDNYNMAGVNGEIMSAFIAGRQAIVNKQYDVRDASIQKISNILERVCINNALSYLEDAKADTDLAAKFHHLSEAIGFLISMDDHIDGSSSEALYPRLYSQDGIDSALNIVGLNSNLWEVDNADIDACIALLKGASNE